MNDGVQRNVKVLCLTLNQFGYTFYSSARCSFTMLIHFGVCPNLTSHNENYRKNNKNVLVNFIKPIFT